MIYKTNSGYGVNFNQVATKPINNRTHNGITYTVNSDGTITADGTATALSYYIITYPTERLVVGHKYLLRGCPQGGSLTTYYLAENTNGRLDYGSGKIWVYSTSIFTRQWVFYITNGTTVNNLTFSFQCFDLTQMFGAGNEPATVADFRDMYPDDYYDYTLSQWQWARKGKITSYPTPVIENGTTLLPIENHIVGLAHYNDGNTDIIYNYAKRELPVGFVRLDYIESTGTQWIDTGYSFTSTNTKVSGHFMPLRNDIGYEQPLVSIWTSDYQYWNIFTRANDSIPDMYTAAHHTLSALTLNLKYSFEGVRNGSDWYFSVGNESAGWSQSFGALNPTTLKILARGDTTIGSFYRIYDIQAYDNDTLVRNFIPCYRYSDGIEGLYDTVGKQFYTNQGTGRFLRGNIIDGGILNNGN